MSCVGVGFTESVSEMDDAIVESPLEFESGRRESFEAHVVGGSRMLVLEIDYL